MAVIKTKKLTSLTSQLIVSSDIEQLPNRYVLVERKVNQYVIIDLKNDMVDIITSNKVLANKRLERLNDGSRHGESGARVDKTNS